MIDLTPLDVRNKRGDFKKLMRGYDPQEVDVFLELVAERLEALVRENIQLRDRTATLQEQVEAQAGREQAVQDALVTAQELRKDIREQSQREADHVMREAESEARRMIAEAESEVRSRLRGVERQMDQSRDSLQELERRRQRFLQEFRGLLQRELDVVEVEEGRVPLEDRTVDLELGGRRASSPESDPSGDAEHGGEAAATLSGADPSAVESPPADAATGTESPPADRGTGTESPRVDAVTGSESLPVDAATDTEPPAADAVTGTDSDSPAADAATGTDAPSLAEAAPTSDLSAFDDGSSAPGGVDPTRDVGDLAPRANDGASEPDEVDSAPVNVADLMPEAPPAPRADAESSGDESSPDPSSAQAPDNNGPSSLELELMAGMGSDVQDGAGPKDYPEVPDLETVLAEAGIDEARPPAAQEISPPPASQKPVDDDDRRPEDRLALFDRDKKGKKG